MREPSSGNWYALLGAAGGASVWGMVRVFVRVDAAHAVSAAGGTESRGRTLYWLGGHGIVVKRAGRHPDRSRLQRAGDTQQRCLALSRLPAPNREEAESKVVFAL